MTPPLSCTVRACGLALERRGRTWSCAGGHAFDVSRSGYVNLLQPQDRRKPAAGDGKIAVQARAVLDAAGVGRTLLETVVRLTEALPLPSGAAVVDLGSGTGEALATLAARMPVAPIGIDLSPIAARHAARRWPDGTWVVANADRRLPLLDASVDLVLSLHARRNPGECARVLKPGGALIVAVPAADDLIELRARVQGRGLLLDRAERVIVDHAQTFVLAGRETVTERRHAAHDLLAALAGATYRGGRLSRTEPIAGLPDMDITMSSEVLLFQPADRGD